MTTVDAVVDTTIEEPFDREIKVLSPPKRAGPVPELPESAYKLDASELKQLYQSTVERRQNLENKPLMTQKLRDRDEADKLKKYPRTTIRIRMPDHTIVQAIFQSKEKVFDLYEFVRSLLVTPERKFVLCLPPRTKLTQPSITLFKAGLSPASNVLFAWIEKGEKGIDLKDEYIAMKEDLTPASTPSPSVASSEKNATPSTSSNTKTSNSSSSKNIPKWLQKGLFNKK